MEQTHRDDEGTPPFSLRDHAPRTSDFRADVLAGLRRPRKETPSKYLYDERGSELFERICEQVEYYPTRTEIAIMKERGGEIAASVGQKARVVEPGSGAGVKTRLLLDLLDDPVAYVPVEISREFLVRSVEDLAESYPGVQMLPVCADFTQPFALPPGNGKARRTLLYFPGSTIGNFSVAESRDLLGRFARLCGGGGALLIGADLKKDVKTLEAAYNDREGVTAQFNLNLLARMNRELGADFRIDRFEHRAFWNPEESCVEGHIRSLENQTVRIGDETFEFRAGETIQTERSHKYSLEDFEELAGQAGLAVERVWMDADRLFSLQFCVPQA